LVGVAFRSCIPVAGVWECVADGNRLLDCGGFFLLVVLAGLEVQYLFRKIFDGSLKVCDDSFKFLVAGVVLLDSGFDCADF
jgi:hypothetical protein